MGAHARQRDFDTGKDRQSWKDTAAENRTRGTWNRKGRQEQDLQNHDIRDGGERMSARSQRSKGEMKTDILKEIQKEKDGLRATHLEDKCGLNYKTIKELLFEMETRDKTIIRGNDKLYTLRRGGEIELRKMELGTENTNEIIRIAMEIAERDPYDEDGYCKYCDMMNYGHAASCYWERLRKAGGVE